MSATLCGWVIGPSVLCWAALCSTKSVLLDRRAEGLGGRLSTISEASAGSAQLRRWMWKLHPGRDLLGLLCKRQIYSWV